MKYPNVDCMLKSCLYIQYFHIERRCRKIEFQKKFSPSTHVTSACAENVTLEYIEENTLLLSLNLRSSTKFTSPTPTKGKRTCPGARGTGSTSCRPSSRWVSTPGTRLHRRPLDNSLPHRLQARYNSKDLFFHWT